MLTRDSIMKTAFDEWGATRYHVTSLSALARALGVSKPAVYRHFRDKDDLIDAMEQDLLARHEEVHAEFLERTVTLGLRETIHAFTDIVLRFFEAHPSYLWFFFRTFVSGRSVRLPDFERITASTACRIACKVREAFPEQTAAFAALAATHIQSAGGSLLATGLEAGHLCGTGAQKTTVPPIGDLPDSTLIDRIRDILTDGFTTSGSHPAPPSAAIDFRALSDSVLIRAEEMLPPDRIFSAISSVIAAEGFMGASVEKIAERLGMTKSSLYFHFRDRSDMLESLVLREHERKASLVGARMGRYRGFEERFAVYLLASMHYFLNNTTVLTAFRWIWYQQLPVRMDAKGHDHEGPEHELLTEAVREGRIDPRGLVVKDIARVLDFLIIRAVMENVITGGDRENAVDGIAGIHRLFLYGIR